MSLSVLWKAVETIYSVICECQLLYPDPELSDSDSEKEIDGGDQMEGDEDNNIQLLQQCPTEFFTSADGLEHLTVDGEAVLAHIESILHTQVQENTQNGNYSH